MTARTRLRVTLESAGVGRSGSAELAPVTASFRAGAVTLLATEGGNRPTILSLVASGRMRLDTGSVTAVDGERRLTPAQLRRAIALIDTPLVAEHSDDVRISTVVREELALAGRSRLATDSRAALGPRALDARARFGSLAADERLRLLIDLALRRQDVAALVVTSPERHGGDPARWWHALRETASRGIAILVVTDAATVAHLERLPLPEPVGDDAIPLFELPAVPTASGLHPSLESRAS